MATIVNSENVSHGFRDSFISHGYRTDLDSFFDGPVVWILRKNNGKGKFCQINSMLDEDTILDKQKQSKEPTGNSNE